MTEVALAREVPLPRLVPALLSFVAGYVDIFTFLGLFGLFVAQVTGSFVTAGAELVTHDTSIIGKVLAIVAFLLATAVSAALIRFARYRGWDALPIMFGLEAALLAIFCVLMLAGPTLASANDPPGIIAGMFAATAMGTQSVIVRLLMRGIPQTNVMTGNMTQIGIETIELVAARLRCAREPGNREHQRELAAARGRLLIVLAIAFGFLAGAACGAVSYAKTGLAGAPLAVVIVGVLALWAVRRERLF
jgi:uncharacterized membrane protein YoaK (UPF0700 family)